MAVRTLWRMVSMKLSKSQAHYIRAVYELSSNCESGVRIVDIAEKLEVSKASASLSMTKLARRGVVRKDAERHVYLARGCSHVGQV